MHQFALLRQRRFGPFFLTQFLGAFNDNVFKNALIILIAFRGASGGVSTDTLINLCAGLFILPFFLFSATAGQIADAHEKAMLIRRIKLAEIAIMTLAAAGFVLGASAFLIGVLFLMGTQSAFFGPIKYAILPQHLREEELVGGNGMVEMGTFVAILLGTLLGGLLIAWPGVGPVAVAAVVIGLAVAGWLASLGIPAAEVTAPGLAIRWNVASETWRIVASLQGNRTVFHSVLGISWFWFYGATFLAQLPNFTRNTLGGDEHVVTLLLTVFSLGIGVGSLLCERLSGKRVEIGLVPLGAAGLTLFALDLALSVQPHAGGELRGALAFAGSAQGVRVIVDLGLLAMFGGFFIVPLYALVQSRSAPERRARVIAANNVLNALFMVASAVVAIALLGSGLGIPELFAVVAVMNAAVAWFIFRLVPEFLVRFVAWGLALVAYRLRTVDVEAIPEDGPVLLVCNHVSLVDALLVMAACRRPIRFVVEPHALDRAPAGLALRASGAIALDAHAEVPAAAAEEIAAALDEGEVVAVFPEGRISEDGELGEFRLAIEPILARSPVPVVALALHGMWGSFFSRAGGAPMSRPRRLLSRLRSPVTLLASAPIAPDEADPARLRETLASLLAETA